MSLDYHGIFNRRVLPSWGSLSLKVVIAGFVVLVTGIVVTFSVVVFSVVVVVVVGVVEVVVVVVDGVVVAIVYLVPDGYCGCDC